MRAVLFASATATTRLGRRRRSPITQGSALVAFERSRLALAPLISSRRKYWLPRLDMPPRRFLPPVEFCRGTRPSHAANSRPLRNPFGSTTVAAIAVAIVSLAAQSLRTQRDAHAEHSPMLCVGAPVSPDHGAAVAGLLLSRLRRHKTHRRPRNRLANRFGIRGVILVALDVRLHILRRHQPHLIAKRTQLPRPVVRRRTCFQANHAWWQFAEECQHLPTPQLFAQNSCPLRINPMHLKNMLR